MPKEVQKCVSDVGDIVSKLVVGDLPQVGGAAAVFDDLGNCVGSIFSLRPWENISKVFRNKRPTIRVTSGDIVDPERDAYRTRVHIGPIKTIIEHEGNRPWMDVMRSTLLNVNFSMTKPNQRAWLIMWAMTVLIFRLAARFCDAPHNGKLAGYCFPEPISKIIQGIVEPLRTLIRGEQKHDDMWTKLICFVLLTDNNSGCIVVDCRSFLSKDVLDLFASRIEAQKALTRTRTESRSIHAGLE